MAWTQYQILLAVVLVITGSINTLSTKWADKMEAVSSDGIKRPFKHPFVQSLSMFLGEILCLVSFRILFLYYKRRNDGSVDMVTLVKGNRNFNRFLFFIPAMCDMCATSIMYIGLSLTYASSFQMLRGSLIVFVALLSVGFLGRKINSREWVGIFFVIIGLTIVGLSDFFLNSSSHSEKGVNDIITGDLLIVLAQIITSIQIVFEEYFVSGQDVPPLQAVGWEGTFGFIVLALLQVPFYFIFVPKPFSDNPRGSLEDFPDAFVQMRNNPLLILAITGTIISIAFFNFAGISVTKEISATTRTVLDSIRTFVIWIVTLALGWQKFFYLQVFGFLFLILGMFIYNDVFVTNIIEKISTWYQHRRAGVHREHLINQSADESH